MAEKRVLRPDDISGINARIEDSITGKVVFAVEAGSIEPMSIGQAEDANKPGRKEALESIRDADKKGLSPFARRILDESVDALLKGSQPPEKFGSIRVGVQKRPKFDREAIMSVLNEYEKTRKAGNIARGVDILADALGQKPPMDKNADAQGALLEAAKARAAADNRFLGRIDQAASRLAETSEINIQYSGDMLDELKEVYPDEAKQRPDEKDHLYTFRMAGLAGRHQARTQYMEAAESIVRKIRPKEDKRIDPTITPEGLARLRALLKEKKKPG
ncbi:MAG: hypothetical protein V1875_07055 [Candidatus Altiarchaeota archaeon]